jgi:hypothetical protein
LSILQVLAIHALEKNATVVYDPSKSLTIEVLAATEKDLRNLVRSMRRMLFKTLTLPSFSVADARAYSKFSEPADTAFGVIALAECYLAGSVSRLVFNDFSMVCGVLRLVLYKNV